MRLARVKRHATMAEKMRGVTRYMVDTVDEQAHTITGAQVPQPGPHFAAHFKVRQYEMDAFGHVNNAVYLHYLEQAATEHAAAAGWSGEHVRTLGGTWVARRHEIEYLRPALGNDLLQVVTWAVEFRGARAFRDYAIHRLAPASGDGRAPADRFLAPDELPAGEPLVTARTIWVWLDLVTGRPRRIPPEMHAAFFDIR